MSKPANIQWSARTHSGRYRKNNEDSFLALTLEPTGFQYLGKIGQAALGDYDFIFAVSDGMGGANSGEFASQIAVQKIADLLPRTFRLGAQGFRPSYGDILEELYSAIQKEMKSMAFHYEECQGMGATLTLAWMTPEWLHFAHVGDSRLYYLPAHGGVKQVTEDHNRAGELLRKGMIDERQARQHPERNVLTNVLGGKSEKVEPQIGSVGLNAKDQFVLCSDGITDGVRDHRLETLIRTPPDRFQEMDVAERLVQDAIEESGKDNCTALVISLSE